MKFVFVTIQTTSHGHNKPKRYQFQSSSDTIGSYETVLGEFPAIL